MWLLNFTRIMLVSSLCATLGAAKLVAPLMEVESLLLFRSNAELKPYGRRNMYEARHPKGHRTGGEHAKGGSSEGDTQEVGCNGYVMKTTAEFARSVILSSSSSSSSIHKTL